MIDPKVLAIREALKDSYGYYNAFYDLSDSFVVESIKDSIRDMSQEGYDPFETPDNKAANLAAFYRVLSYYTTDMDYREFVLEMAKK